MYIMYLARGMQCTILEYELMDRQIRAYGVPVNSTKYYLLVVASEIYIRH